MILRMFTVPVVRSVALPAARWILIGLVGTLYIPRMVAEVPPLLSDAVERWSAGYADLAFTQRVRVFHDDGTLQSERVERYDPSLPDLRRWTLIEVDTRSPTASERQRWETRKNAKPRKAPLKSPREYLDLEHARVVSQTDETVRYEVVFRSDAARFVAVEKIAILIVIDKASGSVGHVSAILKEPIRIALGLARVTGLDLDVTLESSGEDTVIPQDEVQAGSTASVRLSRFGDPMEFHWSDFKRVAADSSGALRLRTASDPQSVLHGTP